MNNVHDDWCSCWKAGHTSPDYSKCDCHIHIIRELQAELTARTTAGKEDFLEEIGTHPRIVGGATR